ncbi:hypothetical protein BS50DRAFT_587151 [Corynespora cassiicola Philippines]|uniref:Uncharacterized protein n=1 Tax=Corynespora cassiicola Philippines TaxID=1448308 RepID=A0A2T2NR98_CORCC|nr:hypothetical protein BS50DRAFT_587151 [Corynespora cassiicola Philippines]
MMTLIPPAPHKSPIRPPSTYSTRSTIRCVTPSPPGTPTSNPVLQEPSSAVQYRAPHIGLVSTGMYAFAPAPSPGTVSVAGDVQTDPDSPVCRVPPSTPVSGFRSGGIASVYSTPPPRKRAPRDRPLSTPTRLPSHPEISEFPVDGRADQSPDSRPSSIDMSNWKAPWDDTIIRSPASPSASPRRHANNPYMKNASKQQTAQPNQGGQRNTASDSAYTHPGSIPLTDLSPFTPARHHAMPQATATPHPSIPFKVRPGILPSISSGSSAHSAIPEPAYFSPPAGRSWARAPIFRTPGRDEFERKRNPSLAKDDSPFGRIEGLRELQQARRAVSWEGIEEAKKAKKAKKAAKKEKGGCGCGCIVM